MRKDKHSKPNRENTAAPRCRTCGDPMIEIDLLIDDQPLTMRACDHCDTRTWHRHGVATELDDILTDLTGVDRRYRRDISYAR